MRPLLLDRLIVREIGGYLAFGLALFTTILVAMQELQPLTVMVVEHHVPLWTALKIFTLSLPYFVALAFPMSTLLSVLLAFGRLSGDSETIALLAAGVRVYRIAVPVALVGLVVSGVTILFNEQVAPVATGLKNALYDQAINAGVPTNRPFHYEQITNGKTVLLIRADNYDGVTKKLVRPTLVYYRDGKPIAIEWSREGRWQGGLKWEMDDGFVQEISDNPSADLRVFTFQTQTTRIGTTIDQLLTASQDPFALTYRQLSARIRQKMKDHRNTMDIDMDRVTLYSKISIPLASLVFALVGYPLGIRRQRSGGAIGLALAILIIFMYYLIFQYASILGNNGEISPMLAAWIPDILGLGVGLTLLQRAAR